MARDRRWLPPPLSKEHGATITLLVSFLTGAWLAGSWSATTTLALLAAMAAFQTQTPLSRMLRRRAIDVPNAIWLAVYTGIATLVAARLWFDVPGLGRIYAVAAAGIMLNLVWIFLRDQKSIPNELAVFFSLTLTLPLAYTATTGAMPEDLLGLWLLMALVSSSSIFTVRLRLQGDTALTAAVVYHLAAISSVFLLARLGLLQPLLTYAMLLPTTKLVAILLWPDRYEQMKLTHIGLVETALVVTAGVWVGALAG